MPAILESALTVPSLLDPAMLTPAPIVAVLTDVVCTDVPETVIGMDGPGLACICWTEPFTG